VLIVILLNITKNINMYVIKKEGMKVPLKIFSKENSIEEQCIEQMEKVCSLPFLHHHVALMPDGHLGIGASIGSVVPTKNVVVPSLVGVDIGCGMCAVKTSLTEIDTDTIKKIMGEIRKVIPVGFNKHKEAQDSNLMPSDNVVGRILGKEYDNALKSLGTLGGGNHFIEIQKGDDGHIWIMIHSGSRNLGFTVAKHYNKLAEEMNEKMFSVVDKSLGLAFLPLESDEGKSYLREMQYCVDFALANRKLMMDKVINIFDDLIPEISQINFDEMINIAHNYAKLENHFGENVMVHRKGATLAQNNTIGIIPGSLGSSSYIVRGLGNPESFNSCSHGAGRKMGRKDAERRLNLEDEIKILKDQNIIHGIRNKSDLDEATGSYKDITKVMNNQKDLVKILVKLRPLGSIKG